MRSHTLVVGCYQLPYTEVLIPYLPPSPSSPPSSPHLFPRPELYGWTMDSIVAQIGLKNNCTFCGVFRRQALDRGAILVGANKIVTGHNADDIAETVIMNVLRGDIARWVMVTCQL